MGGWWNIASGWRRESGRLSGVGVLGRGGGEFWGCGRGCSWWGWRRGAWGQSRPGGCLRVIRRGSGCTALHRAGFANQAQGGGSVDGLRLVDCAITAAVHCAPPDNLPSREERTNCRPWLAATIDLLPVKVLVALGGLAWEESGTRGSAARLARGPRRSLGTGRRWAWRAGDGSWAVSPEPAEHEHRPIDGADVRRRVCGSAEVAG